MAEAEIHLRPPARKVANKFAPRSSVESSNSLSPRDVGNVYLEVHDSGLTLWVPARRHSPFPCPRSQPAFRTAPQPPRAAHAIYPPGSRNTRGRNVRSERRIQESGPSLDRSDLVARWGSRRRSARLRSYPPRSRVGWAGSWPAPESTEQMVVSSPCFPRALIEKFSTAARHDYGVNSYWR
jgi:hypothetical protein